MDRHLFKFRKWIISSVDLTDCDSKIEFAKDWAIVEIPMLIEPLFYDSVIPKTGELPIFSEDIDRDCNPMDIFSYLDTQN